MEFVQLKAYLLAHHSVRESLRGAIVLINCGSFYQEHPRRDHAVPGLSLA